MSQKEVNTLNDSHNEYNIESINKQLNEMTELEEELKQQLNTYCDSKNDSDYQTMTNIANKMVNQLNESKTNSGIYFEGEEIIQFIQKCKRIKTFTRYHRKDSQFIQLMRQVRSPFRPTKIKTYLTQRNCYQIPKISNNDTNKLMIYCVATMEYITAELIEISGIVTKKSIDKNNRKKMITNANDVQQAIINDPEFPDFFKDQNFTPFIQFDKNKVWNPTYYQTKHLISKWLIENKLIM
eukprot:95203_1